MINSSIYLNNLDKVNSSHSYKAEKTLNIGYSDPFYSVLVKHQLNMVKAWTPSQDNNFADIDSLALSKVLLKLKAIDNPDVFRPATKPTINSKQIMHSYESVQNLENEGVFGRKPLENLTDIIADKNKIPRSLFQKLIQTESGYDVEALSPKGAMGLGQIMPETAKELGLNIGDTKTPGSVWHPESNLDASGRYLRKLYDKYRKEGIPGEEAWNFAAGAYNAGMGNIAKAIKIASHEPIKTWNQVAQVLPKITGKYSQETIRYVNRLRA
jgi:soluble lytic murein transglycosylase-like protein